MPIICEHENKVASDRDGNRFCRECAEANELEAFASANHYTGYIGSDERHVTTWTGKPLVTVTALWESKRARRRYFAGVDAQGNRWYGSGPRETGTYVSMHKRKQDRT